MEKAIYVVLNPVRADGLMKASIAQFFESI